MIKRAMGIGLTLSLLGFMTPAAVQADDWDRKTVLTFSQPVEIPGYVLPAGTYIFKLADTMSDRHIVQIFNADGSQIIATVMTIPDYRLKTTDQTVINFNEVPRGAPEAIRAWFYPGNIIGHEFVYSKARAAELARASQSIVPAIAADAADADALKTARITAITPDEQEIPVTVAIQTTPLELFVNVATLPNNSSRMLGTTGVMETAKNASNGRRLPETASALSLIVLLGLGCIGAALGLMIFGKRAPSSGI